MRVILVVDDDALIREELRDGLIDAGFATDTAPNGAEANRLLRRLGYRPDLILLDLMMPVMDGWQFRAGQLRDPSLAPIPVLLLSAAADVRRDCAELKASGYVKKPFHMGALVAAVRDALPH